MLEVLAGLEGPRNDPGQLAFLERYQHFAFPPFASVAACLLNLRAIGLPTWASATFILSSPGETGGQMSRDMAVQRRANGRSLGYRQPFL